MRVEVCEAMGTFLQIGSEKALSFELSCDLRKIFGTIEASCSRFLPSSEVSRINKNAGVSFVKVSGDCLNIIKKSLDIAKFTNGVFDPTIGAVSSLWNIGDSNEYIPTEDEVKKAWSLVNYKNVVIEDDGVFLLNSGMSLDLGGIAKEYAIHKAAKFCEAKGLNGVLLDCGGDISTVGKKSDGSDWRIGIQHPRRRNNLIASINLSDWNCVETSGDYCRFIKKDSIFQSHIFKSKNFKSIALLSVTLVYNRKFDFPLSSSACLAGGLEFSKRMIKKCKGMEAVLVDKDFNVFVTNGLYDKCDLIATGAEKLHVDL